MEMLPLFVSKLFSRDKWYEKDVYFTTADGGNAYVKDSDFLEMCLIYTCLSNQNKCLSFVGSDGRWYKNELCFDKGTLASADLAKYSLDTDEAKLIETWKKVLAEARSTGKCNPDMPYGVYQITQEINTSHKEGSGTTQRTVYDHPELNGHLDTLRTLLKEYYKSHISAKMFKYQLVK